MAWKVAACDSVISHEAEHLRLVWCLILRGGGLPRGAQPLASGLRFRLVSGRMAIRLQTFRTNTWLWGMVVGHDPVIRDLGHEDVADIYSGTLSSQENGGYLAI